MKNQVKIAVLLAIFLFAFPFVAMAGTVSTASLSPADISMTAGSKAQISFSALNDSGLALKNYNIRISYTAGMTVSNLTTDPPAATASVNTRKRYIDLVWSDIPPGTVLQAFFDIMECRFG